MKSLERIPFLANVLIVTCSRPNAEVGKLVKSVVTYVTVENSNKLSHFDPPF